jgi:hypothetical protein
MIRQFTQTPAPQGRNPAVLEEITPPKVHGQVFPVKNVLYLMFVRTFRSMRVPTVRRNSTSMKVRLSRHFVVVSLLSVPRIRISSEQSQQKNEKKNEQGEKGNEGPTPLGCLISVGEKKIEGVIAFLSCNRPATRTRAPDTPCPVKSKRHTDVPERYNDATPNSKRLVWDWSMLRV